MIPFSHWQSNELLNLLPTGHAVNLERADHLPERRLLGERRLLIRDYWQLLYGARPRRFTTEFGRLTGADDQRAATWLRAGGGQASLRCQEIDVLIVNAVDRMSLANALAVSQAARSVLLLGDPQQLEQPILGSHPEGANLSALEHLLAERETLPEDRGLFAEETWCIHPSI